MPIIGIAAEQSFQTKNLIDYLRLKKDFSSKKLELFRNESIELVIGRKGNAGGAAAAAFLINRFDNIEKINFINIGECKRVNPDIKPGTLALCNKITDFAADKSYYPDILISHDLPEISLLTIPAINYSKDNYTGYDCVDSGAAGFMDASFTFLPPHRIFCLKIISGPDPEIKHPAWTDKNLNTFKVFMDQVMQNSKTGAAILTEDDLLFLNRLCASLRFTQTMKNQLYKAAGYYKTAGGNLLKQVSIYLNHIIKHKTESKEIFEKIMKELTVASF